MSYRDIEVIRNPHPECARMKGGCQDGLLDKSAFTAADCELLDRIVASYIEA